MLEHLSLDLMPVDSLSILQLDSFDGLANVSDLQIGFTNTQWLAHDRSSSSKSLRSFFSSMPLRVLSLTLGTTINDDIHWGGHGESEITLQDTFYSLEWPHLEKLRIIRMKTDASRLSTFFSKHALLKSLSLYLSLEPGRMITFKKMLTKFQDNFNFDHFELIAHQQTAYIYDDNWNEIDGTESGNAKVS